MARFRSRKISPPRDPRLLFRRRMAMAPDRFAELVLWELPSPVVGCDHSYKYRLALIHKGVCVLRYDNERGKGDHIHVGENERPYSFENLDRLIADFEKSVHEWLDGQWED